MPPENSKLLKHTFSLNFVGDIPTLSGSMSLHCGNEIRKVIYNDPYTIVLTWDGNKYISKAHDEAFDKEKGLLMCIAKANGVSHSQLKRLMASAKDCKAVKD